MFRSVKVYVDGALGSRGLFLLMTILIEKVLRVLLEHQLIQVNNLALRLAGTNFK